MDKLESKYDEIRSLEQQLNEIERNRTNITWKYRSPTPKTGICG